MKTDPSLPRGMQMYSQYGTIICILAYNFLCVICITFYLFINFFTKKENNYISNYVDLKMNDKCILFKKTLFIKKNHKRKGVIKARGPRSK